MFTAHGDGESAAEFQYHLFEIIRVALAAGVALIVTLSWTIYFPYSRSLPLKGTRVIILYEGILYIHFQSPAIARSEENHFKIDFRTQPTYRVLYVF